MSILHKKWSFPWRISSVNVTKSAGICGLGHIYWRNPSWKTSFFVQCYKCRIYQVLAAGRSQKGFDHQIWNIGELELSNHCKKMKKFLMENFIFCAVNSAYYMSKCGFFLIHFPGKDRIYKSVLMQKNKGPRNPYSGI